MRALAEFIMRGRTQATLVVVMASAIPFLFWLSAAAVNLVIQRRGWSQGAPLLMWASLPAMYWLMMGNPAALLTLVGSAAMATYLRHTVSWSKTMGLMVLVGVVTAIAVQYLMPEQMAQMSAMAQKLMETEILVSLQEPAKSQFAEQVPQLMPYIMLGLVTWSCLLFALLALMLGRWWQALLYHPGAFQKEFHALRLPKGLTAVLVLLLFFGASINPALAVLIPIVSLPLFVAGLALVHALVTQRNLGVQWLYIFYFMLTVLTQFIYPVIIFIALMDSLLDLRSRMRATPSG